jgi:hypothetical protein
MTLGTKNAASAPADRESVTRMQERYSSLAPEGPRIPELVGVRALQRCATGAYPNEFPEGTLSASCRNQAVFSSPTCLERYSEVRFGDLVWVQLVWLAAFVRGLAGPPPMGTRSRLSQRGAPGSCRAVAPLNRNPGCRSESIFIRGRASIWADISHRLVTGIGVARDVATAGGGSDSDGPPGFRTVGRFTVPGSRICSILERIPANECGFSKVARLSGSEVWRMRGGLVFVGSLFEFGLDCHGNWEALALGRIVIVPHSPLEHQFRGLAVRQRRRLPRCCTRKLKVVAGRTRPLHAKPRLAD